MTSHTELVLKDQNSSPEKLGYDAIREQMNMAPIMVSNEDTATDFMTKYHYAVWPVSETESGRIMVEIQEPKSTIEDEHGTIYDTSPVVDRAETVRLFMGLMDSPLGLVLKGLGYKSDKIVDSANQSTIFSIETPNLDSLAANAANGLIFEQGQHVDEYTSLLQKDCEQTEHLAKGRFTLGENEETVTGSMIWLAPFIAMIPPEITAGVMQMSKIAQSLEATDDFHRKLEKGRPAAILKHFSIRGNVITLLNNALNNPGGIPGVDYSPVDELGFEINSLFAASNGGLVDDGKLLAEATLTHVKRIRYTGNE